MFPETSYTRWMHCETSLAIPTKMKLAVLSALLPHRCEGRCSYFFFSTWRRLHIYSVQPDLQLNSAAGPMQRPDITLQALILCTFQGIVGGSEAVPFLRWLSGYAAPLSSQCVLLTAAQSTSVWIRKMLKHRGISCSSSIAIDTSFWPNFLNVF